ncbi:MAG: hypothetical protein AAFP92_01795 [Bacteroidota bacterium]
MKIIQLLGVMAFVCLIPNISIGQITEDTVQCNSHLNAISSIFVDETFIYSNQGATGTSIDPLWLDEPELTLDFTSAAGCVKVDFSTMARVIDNHIVFQVQLDGIPMPGHGLGYLTTNITDPIISERDEFDATFNFIKSLRDKGVIVATDQQLNDAASTVGYLPRMLTYTLVAEVDSGDHTVELFLGGCCGGGTSHIINPTLVAQYLDPETLGTVNINDPLNTGSQNGYLGISAPNPARDYTSISYQVPHSAQHVQLLVFDLTSGRAIKQVVLRDRGSSQFRLARDNMPAGTYAYQLIVDGAIVGTRKLVWVD